MAVTDIVRVDHPFSGHWLEPEEVEKKYLETEIDKYNISPSRFLSYPWGVWVTAYARKNLFTAIFECKSDYIYSDTDSVKIINADKHKGYFEAYNNHITRKLENALDYHDLDPVLIRPKNIKGEEKPLGVWSFDGYYSRFKTLGAKRYLVEYDDTKEIQLTVAGLNKKICVPYLLKKYGKDGIFEHFANGLYIPPGETGKMTHTYIDTLREGDITDYTGKTAHYKEKSCVHLENSDYSLSLAREYVEYFIGLREE